MNSFLSEISCKWDFIVSLLSIKEFGILEKTVETEMTSFSMSDKCEPLRKEINH